jgi:hypothetical protein
MEKEPVGRLAVATNKEMWHTTFRVQCCMVTDITCFFERLGWSMVPVYGQSDWSVVCR